MVGNVSRVFNNYNQQVIDESDFLSNEQRNFRRAKPTFKPRPQIRSHKFQSAEHLSKATDPKASQRDLMTAASQYLSIWRDHEMLWNKFEKTPSLKIHFESIPFPPCDSDVLEFLIVLNSEMDDRSAYLMACRRWHPDKFMQNFGQYINPEEHERVRGRLTAIAQAINTAWKSLSERNARVMSRRPGM